MLSSTGTDHRSNLCYSNIVLNSSLPIGTNHLNVFHLNVCSLLPKIHDVRRIVLNTQLNIVCVTESWLTSSDTSRSIYLPGFTSFRHDRSSGVNRGGGVVIYVKKRFKTRVLCRSSVDGIEFIFVEVSLGDTKVVIGCVYLPYPSVALLNVLKSELDNLVSVYDEIIIMGDFNIDILTNCSLTRRYKQILDCHGLQVLNSCEPTHFVNSISVTSASLIDHAIVRSAKVSQVSIINQLLGVSNHDCIYISYSIPIRVEECAYYTYRDYKNCNVDELCLEVAGISWETFYNLPSVDERTNLFNLNLLQIFNKYLPIKRAKSKREGIPWYDPLVEKVLVERDMAFYYWRSTRTTTAKNNYKRLRNRGVFLVRLANRRYSFSLLNPKFDGKKLWNNLGKLGLVETTGSNEVLFSADDLNTYFLSSQPSIGAPSNWSISGTSPSQLSNFFSFHNVTYIDVLQSLLSIKSNSIGLDNISPKFIKLILHLILPQITFLFNSVLTQSCFPSAWKFAKVVPVPKKSSPISISDFRPISILPYLSKALEKIMKNQICEYIHSHNIISEFQSAYRPKHSTTTALLKVTGDIRKNIDCRNLTILVLLDFSKAFDSVDFDILSQKLVDIGFSSSSIKLIRSYLFGRTQCVLSNDQFSNSLQLSTGVPQGSILGPLLFSLFINDLTHVLQCSYHLFADDVQIYTACTLSDISFGVRRINNELQKVVEWAKQNKLQLNVGKTQAIAIYGSQLDTAVFPPLLVNNVVVPYSSKVKNLGIMMDNTLKWHSHVNLISSKVHFILRRLWRFSYLTPLDIKIKLVKSLILPLLTYGDVVLGALDSTESSKLNVLFNTCTRYVFCIRRFDHISPYTTKVLGCTFLQYLKYRQCLFMFRVLKDLKPDYLHRDIVIGSSVRTKNIIIPKHRSRYLANSFMVYSAGLWNDLPYLMRRIDSLAKFKCACLEYYST